VNPDGTRFKDVLGQPIALSAGIEFIDKPHRSALDRRVLTASLSQECKPRRTAFGAWLVQFGVLPKTSFSTTARRKCDIKVLRFTKRLSSEAALSESLNLCGFVVPYIVAIMLIAITMEVHYSWVAA
jgi:hypothetical protein